MLNHATFVPVLERSDPEKQEMEKQIWELRAQLNHSAVMSEIEELKRCIERKDKEKAQLGIQIEVNISLNDKLRFYYFLSCNLWLKCGHTNSM